MKGFIWGSLAKATTREHSVWLQLTIPGKKRNVLRRYLIENKMKNVVLYVALEDKGVPTNAEASNR